MVQIKANAGTKWQQACGAVGTFMHCWWECNLVLKYGILCSEKELFSKDDTCISCVYPTSNSTGRPCQIEMFIFDTFFKNIHKNVHRKTI